MKRPTLHALLGAVMILGVSGCDNVEWGGVDLRLEGPPPVDAREAAESETGAAPEDTTPDLPPLPEGRLLLMGSRSGDRISLRPIAEISGDSLNRLVTDAEAPGYGELLQRTLLAPGTRFTLFSGSGRVGTVRADTTFASSGFCTSTPIVEGVAELIPAAAQATRFVALAESPADARPYASWLSPNHSYEQRVASIELASSTIAQNGATWPESVLGTRVDMQAVPLDGDVDGALAATFVYRDRLSVGPADAASSWSIFVLGVGGPEQYAPAFRRYRRVGDDGKGVARYWEQADWDGDGENEILLQVFGEDARWTAALDRRDGGWTTIFEDACGPAGR